MKTNPQGIRRSVLSTGTPITLGVIIFLACAAPAFGQWATNGNDISNTNSGNVGIGTTSPQKLFHMKA